MPSHVRGIHCAVPLAGLIAFAACHEPVCASKRAAAAREAERVRQAAQQTEDQDRSDPIVLADTGRMIWDRPAKSTGPDSKIIPARPPHVAAWDLRPRTSSPLLERCGESLARPDVLSPEHLRGTLHRPQGPPSLA
jgi:hypothetical protein